MNTIVAAIAVAAGLASPISAQQDDTVYKPGPDVSLPKGIKDVTPHYTPDAVRRRVTGSVLLRCVVDRDGVPTSVELQPAQALLDAPAPSRVAPGTPCLSAGAIFGLASAGKSE